MSWHQRLPKIIWPLGFPIALIYAYVVELRRRRSRPYRAKKRILCIGNLHVGGSGKTPLVKEIARRFKAQGVAVVSRGYLGKLSSKGALVNPDDPGGASLYGDEPMELAQLREFPVWIGANRRRTVELLEKDPNINLMVFDDGFQNFEVEKNVSIIVIHGSYSPEDSFTLPLGPLREPFRNLRYAHAIVLVRDDFSTNLTAWENFLGEHFAEIPRFVIDSQTDPVPEGKSWYAFSGIANPERFHRHMEASSNVSFVKTFRDHYPYDESDLSDLIKGKELVQADGFVTTQKDWQKVGERLSAKGQLVKVLSLHYSVPEEFFQFLTERLANNER